MELLTTINEQRGRVDQEDSRPLVYLEALVASYIRHDPVIPLDLGHKVSLVWSFVSFLPIFVAAN
eukprot:scaffold7349_cov173-Amphora_coffeaeformis.AAC.28